MRIENQNGNAVILAVLILSIVLAIALGLSAIMLKEVQFNRTAGFNVPAFFGADSGIEKLLTIRNIPISSCPTAVAPCTLSNGVTYWVVVTANGGTKPDGTSCASANYCIESTGSYRGTRRAMEANY